MSAILKFGNFLIDDVELKKQLSVEKPIVKGYNFYKSGKVQGIYTKQQEELFYIKSQVVIFFFFCILFVFGFLQFLQVRKIHHKFLHA